MISPPRICRFCAVSVSTLMRALKYDPGFMFARLNTPHRSRHLVSHLSSGQASKEESPVAAKTPKKHENRKTKTTVRMSQNKKQTVSALAQINMSNPALDIFDGIKFADVVQAQYPKAQELLASFPSNRLKEKFLKEGLSAHQLTEHMKKQEKSMFRYRIVHKLQPPDEYKFDDDEVPIKLSQDNPSVVRRPPVVTILGHVDHGKTTLLDYLRKSNIAEGEHGGITQRIGAFNVKLADSGDTFTFIDTPGHAAFDRMRERGTQCTDIVILIVAADDGVMAQTEQCIQFIRKYNTPFIVAITKIDKSNADVERVELQLEEFGVDIEKRGGSVPCVPISIYKGVAQNLEELLDTIETMAEIVGPTADPTSRTEGVVIEAKTETEGAQRNRKSASVIVKQGTLDLGQVLVCGKTLTKVKTLVDENGNRVSKVQPGRVAQIIGWKNLPDPGDYVVQILSEQRAREIVEKRENYDKMVKDYEKSLEAEKILKEERKSYVEKRLNSDMHFAAYKLANVRNYFEDFVNSKKVEKIPNYSLFVRADNQGSLEAVMNVLKTFDSAFCTMVIVNTGVGPLSENELEYAKALDDGLVLYFNLPALPSQSKNSGDEKVLPVINESVIYSLIDKFTEYLENSLPKVPLEVEMGEAVVKQTFKSGKDLIAGCKVTKGVLNRRLPFKIVRGDNVLSETTNVTSLRHVKDVVDSVEAGKECGILFKDFTDFQVGDKVICTDVEMHKPELEWNPDF